MLSDAKYVLCLDCRSARVPDRPLDVYYLTRRNRVGYRMLLGFNIIKGRSIA